MLLNIDEILEKCGDFNKYQFILMGLFSYINIITAMHYYSQTIISFVPEHWCYSDALVNLTFSEIRDFYKNYSDPLCTNYNIVDLNINNSNNNNNQSTEVCTKWIYNYDYGYHSMTTDLNWICENAWKSTLGQSMYFIGSVIGTLGFGILADKIGRLIVLILANLVGMLGNLLTIFATDVSMFSICRFISGLATDSNFVMMYILVIEYIRPDKRTFSLNLCIGIFYCIGTIITPWLAILVKTWYNYLLAISIPILLIPFYYFIIIESVQWLITKNYLNQTIKNLLFLAKINKKHLSENFINNCRNNIYNYNKKQCDNNNIYINNINNNNNKDDNYNNRNGKVNPSFIDLFKTKRLRRNTFILLFKSIVITLCYDAISRNVEGLGVSPFIMFSLSSTAILPACLILLFLQDKLGRKAMASLSLLICGVFTSATGIFIAYQNIYHDPILLSVLTMIGRLGVTVAYNSGAQYAFELIPTCVRAQGVAAVHVFGYAFTFFSTYILYLGNIFKPLPSLVLGSLSIVGAILCLFLPETLNKTLPCTLEDGENFGLNEKIFEFSFNKKNNSKKTQSTNTLEKY